jgi:hypothetical protein
VLFFPFSEKVEEKKTIGRKQHTPIKENSRVTSNIYSKIFKFRNRLIHVADLPGQNFLTRISSHFAGSKDNEPWRELGPVSRTAAVPRSNLDLERQI